MKKYIIITGGELCNKGAQEMTFITINELKKRFPKHEVVLLSDLDYKRTPYEKKKYNFLIRSSCMYTKRLYDPFDIWAQKTFMTSRKSDDMIKILENTEFMVDISGFALSSSMVVNSSLVEKSLGFLHRIYVAKYYGIKVFILPQSFGPFEYGEKYSKLMDVLLKILLKYPDLICAREEAGYRILKKYCNNNLLKCDDIVWSNFSDFVWKNIYKEKPPVHDISIETKNNIAIIPSIRLIQVGERKNETIDYISFYNEIIEYMLNKNFHTYLISHSEEDMKLCRAIKGSFLKNENIVSFDCELDFWEIEELLTNIDFAIASRFHSVVHAYKKSVPTVVIGWADKYKEMARKVCQEKYVIDIRNDKPTSEQVINLFETLYDNAANERIRLNQRIAAEKQKESVFDKIK